MPPPGTTFGLDFSPGISELARGSKVVLIIHSTQVYRKR